MGRRERQRELARRRSRRSKLQMLRSKYQKSTNDGEKMRIAAKVRRLSPFVDLEREAAEAKQS